MYAQSIKSLKGIVTACSWGGDGEISGISLETEGEKSYRILSFQVELLKELHNVVLVKGILSKDDQGNEQVSVLEFRRVGFDEISC